MAVHASLDAAENHGFLRRIPTLQRANPPPVAPSRRTLHQELPIRNAYFAPESSICVGYTVRLEFET